MWPEYKNNILVTCSVYRACQKVCISVNKVLAFLSLFLQIWGPDVHALPVRRSPVSIVTSDDDGCESVSALDVVLYMREFKVLLL